MKLTQVLVSMALFLPTSLASPNDDLVLAITMVNRVREAHGINPLAWSPDLAAYAQFWASQMGSGSQPFSHAPPELRPKQGENIFHHTSPQCDADYNNPLQTAVRAWLAQEKLYTGQPIRDGKEPWLHWSQCMWSKTTHIGCSRAYSISEPLKFFDVCRFFPEGNM
ncbi:hypothetical protein FDECE_14620 [Fusarium decemcellulare]|nr:hypothetical protein FDECE_14620 [Fusarium decemcellulare]